MPKKDFYIAVHPGEVLQNILDESGITQTELARHLTIPHSKIVSVQPGKGDSPHFSTEAAPLSWFSGSKNGDSPHFALEAIGPERLPKINEICRGRRGISATMAAKLGRAFGQSPGFWINLQKNWELSRVDKSEFEAIKRLALR